MRTLYLLCFFGFIVISATFVSDTFSTINSTLFQEIETTEESSGREYLLCRGCGARAADLQDLLALPSEKANYSFNETLFGRKGLLVQLFSTQPPFVSTVPVVQASSAECYGVGEWQSEQDWFPGYAWRACLCAECGAQLGWHFVPADDADANNRTFYCLALDGIVGEHFVDSLLVAPKLKPKAPNPGF